MPDPSRLIPCPIRRHALDTPDAPAVIQGDEVISYADLDRGVTAAEAALADDGRGAGSRLALIGPAHVQLLETFWAGLRRRAILCPQSDRLPVEALRERLAALEAFDITDPTLSPAEPVGLPVFDLDAPAVALYTSGSSGTPKAALLTAGNLYFNALGSFAAIPLGAGDEWILSLPLYHVSGIGILVRAALAGAAVVLPGDEELADLITRGSATHMSLVPTQLLRLLDAGVRPDGLKAVLLGGSQIPGGLLERALAAGWPIHTTYGLTETASQVTTTPAGAGLDTLQSAGTVLPHRELRVDAAGEIHVRGEVRFAGYLTPQGLITPFDAEGWYATGDLGRLDGEGRLHVVGRKDNLFISGGENIQPEEIEQAIMPFPGILRALVVPVPDAVYGARPFAFLEWDGGFAGEAALRSYLEARLPRFKIPVVFAPWPADAPAGIKPARRWFEERARVGNSG